MEDCTVTTELIDGHYHTYYSRDGIIVAECIKLIGDSGFESWYRGDKLHREDGPADIWYVDGQIVKEVWYCDDKQHRDGGPALISYDNGQKTVEIWYCHDKTHRDDGPAIIWYRNGQKISEFWYCDGNPRLIGLLASVIYQNIDSEYNYWTGNKYVQDIDEFRDAVKGYAIHDVLRPLPIPIRQAIIPHYCYQ